jgi:ketosteroid isomerase-like protein
MTNQSYMATITVANTPQDVFDRICEVPKWWSKDFEGHSAALRDEFVICHPGAHYTKQQLIEAVPGRKLVWLVTESKLDWLKKDMEEWTNTKMIFEISAEGDKTELRFTHEGLVPGKECYERCSQGWEVVIKELLFQFIVAGKTI